MISVKYDVSYKGGYVITRHCIFRDAYAALSCLAVWSEDERWSFNVRGVTKITDVPPGWFGVSGMFHAKPLN